MGSFSELAIITLRLLFIDHYKNINFDSNSLAYFFAFRSITISCIAIFRLDLSLVQSNTDTAILSIRYLVTSTRKAISRVFGAGSRLGLPTFGL